MQNKTILVIILSTILLTCGCITNADITQSTETVPIETPFTFNPVTDIFNFNASIPTPTETPPIEITSKVDSIEEEIKALYPDHAPTRQYVIDANRGSDIYVCTHFSIDMAQSLVDAGYNAGVVIDHNHLHAIIWVELHGQVYIIEPQGYNGYYTLEEFDKGRNINVISVQKGREHAKQSAEVFHS